MVIKKTTKKKAKEYVIDFLDYLEREKGLPIESAYFFGSYVKGRPKNWSDIDIAVVSNKFGGATDPYEYLWKNLRDIDVERGIEPVGFHPKTFVNEDPLVWEIKQHGVRVL